MVRRWLVAALFVVAFSPLAVHTQSTAPALAPAPAQAQAQAPALSLAEQEEFLKKAKVIRTRGVNVGITGTQRATLSDGVLTHDASIQTIDEYKQRFEGTQGTEFNFRDTWRYNVAAYRLDKLLELGMTPPSVERSFNGKVGSFTWWVDDVLMDEGARLKKKVEAPVAKVWNEQMWHVRMFDQLIYNVDRNLGNLLIDTGWRIWMIDHTRAFRVHNVLKAEGNLSRLDRRVLERLKALDRNTLKKVMDDYLSPSEIDTMLKRRDLIVQRFEKMPALVFDWERPVRPAQ